jgi:hypothetical protein
MKIATLIGARRESGHALLMVLTISAAALLMVAATMNRTSTDVALNARNNQYQASLYAAEAATESVVARVKQDFLAGDLTWVTNSLYAGTYHKSIPTNDTYWSNFEFSDGLGHSGSNLVICLFRQGWSPLRSQYAGLSGWTNHLFVVSNVKQRNSQFNITAAVQQDIELDLIPIFQFAIFYNSLLEFTWCAPMTVNGRTHANGNMYTGSAWQLTFNDIVDVTGTITSPSWGGYSSSQYSVPARYNPNYSTNSNSLVLPIGTSNSPAAVREIIQMPPVGGDTNGSLASQRYYNKAQVVLLVSNTTVSAIYKTSMHDSSPNVVTARYYPTNNNPSNYTAVTTNFPFISITNLFPSNPNPMTDLRENDVLKLTDIDVSVLKKWLVTNALLNAKFPNTAGVYASSTNAPNIMYVADNRSYNNGQLTAVRLREADIIPTNLFVFTGSNAPSGFTLATPNPLYVYGNYNVPNSAGLNSTNTTAAGAYPASLISDALTILSDNWQDSKSTGAVTTRTPTSTTVNAAILTGVVYSTGSSDTTFSGGVHNLPRLLENWSTSTKLTLNTSIVNLFNSARATNQFQRPGVYYNAPTRQFSFDPNFLYYYKQPPGTPMLSYVIRSRWSAVAPGSTNYAGF